MASQNLIQYWLQCTELNHAFSHSRQNGRAVIAAVAVSGEPVCAASTLPWITNNTTHYYRRCWNGFLRLEPARHI
jgi:hypothetical protein